MPSSEHLEVGACEIFDFMGGEALTTVSRLQLFLQPAAFLGFLLPLKILSNPCSLFSDFHSPSEERFMSIEKSPRLTDSPKV